MAGFALFILTAVPALADPYHDGRTILFGDSLSDNGNLFHNTGTMPPSPPYFDGRFSNGPTWIERFANPSKSSNPDSSLNRFWGGEMTMFAGPFDTGAGVDNVDAAIGGAAVTTGFSLGGVPSVTQQIGAFLGAGGTFAAKDLVVVQGGANDFFSEEPGKPGPAQIANNQVANVSTVVGNGGRTVLIVNVPDLGTAPAYNSDPTQAAAARQWSDTYNTSLEEGVWDLAKANGEVNLVQMDVSSAVGVVIANPGAFGLTNVTDACVMVSDCDNTTAEGFLFFDPVHPASAGHALIARYAALLLSTRQAGKAVGALGQVGVTTRLEASDILFRNGVPSLGSLPSGLYIEGVGQTGANDGRETKRLGDTGFDFTLGGVRAGFDANRGPAVFGASFAYQAGNIDGHLLTSDVSTIQADVYALTHFAPFFVGAEAGLSYNEYDDVERFTGFSTVFGKGSTSGIGYSAAATLGAQHHLGSVVLTPAVRIGYVSTDVDGFKESAPILGLKYDDRTISAGFWTARLRAGAPVLESRQGTVYGEIGYEDLFAVSDGYHAKLAHNTAHAVTIEDDVTARGLFLKLGIGGHLTDRLEIGAEYGLAFQNGAGNVHWGRLRLSMPL